MRGYILRRVLISLPVILLVGIITFTLLRLAPGNPAAILAGEQATPQEVARLHEAMGLDKPIPVQFAIWAGGLFKGDLGTSIFSGRSVTSLMAPRIQPTVSLAVLTLLISIVLGVSLGMAAAWRPGSTLDRVVMISAVIGFTVPIFWVGYILIGAVAVRWELFPAVGFVPISQGFVPFLHSLTLPALANAFPATALLSRMVRSTMIETLKEDYVRTARAKGLPERVVLARHAFKNAAIPIVTVVGLVFANLMAGVVVIETVFGIPGLGRLVVDAVTRRDYPIVQATLMVVAVSYILVNLLVDVVYVYLDPRIRY